VLDLSGLEHAHCRITARRPTSE